MVCKSISFSLDNVIPRAEKLSIAYAHYSILRGPADTGTTNAVSLVDGPIFPELAQPSSQDLREPILTLGPDCV